MPRIRYAVAMSLDGYIAGPKGESDWIIMDPDIDFRAIFPQIDTFLMGRRTFEAMGGAGGPATTGGIWLFGGGLLFRSFLDAGLVDTVEVAVIPVLLGGGLPLLPHPAHHATLAPTGHRVYQTGIVSLEYAVAKLAA